MNARLTILLAVLACALGLAAAGAGAATPRAPLPDALADGDPLAFRPGQVAALERAAAFGHSRPLYARSPGGVFVTARRTARFRPLIERAVAGSGFSADLLEAIVFLESAGRADAIAGGDAHSASGLVQIMGGTANDFLGLDVDLRASAILTRRIEVARRRGNEAAVRRLRIRRARVDARFDPPRALAAAVRYLTIARSHLGRNDLAVVSYHMGIGNLQDVLRAYAGTADARVPYARVYFDSAPDRHPEAWERLSTLGDDSLHYYFKVLAARRIMRLYRTAPRELAVLARLHARKHSHEEVMHPAARTSVYRAPRELARARVEGELLPLPNWPDRLRFEVSPDMGSLAPALAVRPRRYRALRPEALATLAYVAQRVRQVGETTTPIVVTSTVRDSKYQRRLQRTNRMAARSYSIHTTGYAFDLARTWNSERQAAAVQFVLDRLVSHGLIAYIKEPHAIHVAVSRDAARLVPAMLGPKPQRAPAAAPPPVGPPAAGQAPAPVAPADPPAEWLAPDRLPGAPPQPPPRAERPAERPPGFFQQLRALLDIV